jgi:hypothetical protein
MEEFTGHGRSLSPSKARLFFFRGKKGLSLLPFVMLYKALTAWFVYQTYALFTDAFESGSGFVTYIIAAGTGLDM